MKIYKHWLEIDGNRDEVTTKKAWSNLEKYLTNNPSRRMNVYLRNSGNVFSRIIYLESIENYKNLDLDCNSLFEGSLKKLFRKPSNIELCKKDIQYFFNN